VIRFRSQCAVINFRRASSCWNSFCRPNERGRSLGLMPDECGDGSGSCTMSPSDALQARSTTGLIAPNSGSVIRFRSQCAVIDFRRASSFELVLSYHRARRTFIRLNISTNVELSTHLHKQLYNLCKAHLM
jgi:hypothetical protein